MQARLLMAEREMTRRRQIIVGLRIEPYLQYIADTKSLAVPCKQAPCALQHTPEQHKAFFIILYFHFLND